MATKILLLAALLCTPLIGCTDAINEANPNTLLSVTQRSYEDCQIDWIMLDAGETITLTVRKSGGFWAEAALQVDDTADVVLNVTVEKSQDEASTTGTVPETTEYMLSVCATERATATLSR